MSQRNQKYLTFLNVTVASDLLINLITALHLISTLPNEQLETKKTPTMQNADSIIYNKKNKLMVEYSTLI